VWYLLFFVALMIVTGVFVWDYRRKAARRDAASRERYTQMFEAGPPAAAGTAPLAPAASVAAPQPAPLTETPPDAPAVIYAARERLLSQPEKLIYLLLKTGLPDHEIFSKVPLTAVIQVPGMGYDHEQQLRRLSRQVLDFVVCDKGMKVVAALQLAPVGPEAVIAQRIRSECLKSAGIRLVTIEPGALPKRSDVRALVCGEASGPAAVSVGEKPRQQM
jgi:hypothetical protein